VRYGTCLPGLGVRVQGVLGVSIVRAGMDSESGSLAVALPTLRAPIFPVGGWTPDTPHPHGADFSGRRLDFRATPPNGAPLRHDHDHRGSRARTHRFIRMDPVGSAPGSGQIRPPSGVGGPLPGHRAGLACGVEVFGRPAPRRNSIEALRSKIQSPPPRLPAPHPHL